MLSTIWLAVAADKTETEWCITSFVEFKKAKLHAVLSECIFSLLMAYALQQGSVLNASIIFVESRCAVPHRSYETRMANNHYCTEMYFKRLNVKGTDK